MLHWIIPNRLPYPGCVYMHPYHNPMLNAWAHVMVLGSGSEESIPLRWDLESRTHVMTVRIFAFSWPCKSIKKKRVISESERKPQALHSHTGYLFWKFHFIETLESIFLLIEPSNLWCFVMTSQGQYICSIWKCTSSNGHSTRSFIFLMVTSKISSYVSFSHCSCCFSSKPGSSLLNLSLFHILTQHYYFIKISLVILLHKTESTSP